MIELEELSRPACVIGPVGEPLTLETLPPQNTRWVARRKAEVVAAVDGDFSQLRRRANDTF